MCPIQHCVLLAPEIRCSLCLWHVFSFCFRSSKLNQVKKEHAVTTILCKKLCKLTTPIQWKVLSWPNSPALLYVLYLGFLFPLCGFHTNKCISATLCSCQDLEMNKSQYMHHLIIFLHWIDESFKEVMYNWKGYACNMFKLNILRQFTLLTGDLDICQTFR